MSTICSIDRIFAKKWAPENALQQEKIASLFAAAREGHVCLPTDPCLIGASFISYDPQDLFPKQPICSAHNLIYLQKNWVYETQLLQHVKRVLHTPPKPIPYSENTAGLLETQKKAVHLVSENSLTLITGGPGTGKSHVIVHIVKTLSSICRVLVAAPTGRAVSHIAERLQETSATFSTLHALLPPHFEEPIDADCIIVDESSMVDLCFFSRLCARIAKGTRLVLVGDKDQLPPIGSGSIFADLLDIPDIPSVILDQSMRFEENEILHYAHAIQQGKSGVLIDKLTDFDLHSIITSVYPQPSSIEPDAELLFQSIRKACILSCLRAGPMGVDTCNHIALSFMKKQANGNLFWAAPIVIVRNSSPLYNGDMGIMIHQGETPINAIFKTGRLPAYRLPPFEYAYALSVHKSQGCEYDNVFLLIPPGSEVFGKQALYTAVTRAKKHITLHGHAEALSAMLQTSSRRQSGIGKRWKN